MNVEVPEHETASIANDWGPRSRILGLVLFVATFGGIYICYLLAAPFLSALTWALVLAVLSAAVHRAIEARLRRPNLSATISVLMVALIVVVPATFVAERLISEAAKGAIVIQTQVEGGAWRSAIDAHPWIAPIDQWIEQQINLPAIFGNVASWLTNTGASFVRGSVVQLIGVVLTFYALLFPSGPSLGTRDGEESFTAVTDGDGPDFQSDRGYRSRHDLRYRGCCWRAGHSGWVDVLVA